VKVLLVDDDALIRESMQILLDLEEDVETVWAAADGREALALCAEAVPDVVLMDVRMPHMDGVEATKRLKELYPDLPVVILTTFKDDAYIREAVRHGAAGYLLKNQPSETIINTLRAVRRGQAVFQQDVAQSLWQMLGDAPADCQEAWELTERETDVLRLIGEGYSNREIAASLFLSEGTVRNYVTVLLDKLQVRDRTQLAIAYLKRQR